VKFPLRGTGLRRYTRKNLRHDRDAARAEVLRLERQIRTLDAANHAKDQRIAELEANAVDVSVERQLHLLAEERANEFESKFRALKAQVDNEHAITVPPMHRDIEPDETSTQPILAATLAAALDTAAA
jgi:septal ring factor EnvC (AmiA/AmiB activator)